MQDEFLTRLINEDDDLDDSFDDDTEEDTEEEGEDTGDDEDAPVEEEEE